MVKKMFDIVGCQILSFGFGGCCHNRSIFQVNNLCSFADFCCGRVGNNGRKEVGKDGEVGKCLGCVLGEISLCLL